MSTFQSKFTGHEIEHLLMPDVVTSLPAGALAANTPYIITDPVGAYTFQWPTGFYWCWLRFTTGASPNITFPAGTKYIGAAPAFEAAATYEMMVMADVVAVQEVVDE